jgi:pyruvate dehydrogenase E2 component (dihydrolipoamide acetyltransferase)/2-oxoisovalerate dehydrogenase E2 component (dihydrolipoyl transacylase)
MDFPLPPVGEGLIEVELVRWLVRPGDAVARGQGLAEVMSDKATMEVPSPFAGTVTTLAATPGSKVKVGESFLTYEAVGDVVATPGPRSAARPTSPPSVEGKGAGGLGQRLSPNPQPLPSEGRGDKPGETFRNGSAVAHAPQPPAAPSVRLLARKLGVELARVRGTGPGGRILVEDLAPYLRPKAGPADHPVPPHSGTDTTKLDLGVAGTRRKLVGMRRRIAEHMIEAKNKIPHYSYIDECNLTDLVRLRAQLRDPLAKTGVKLTYLAFFVKAAARALKDVPIVNSTFDEAAGEVVLLDHYHLGVAVAAPGGLIVPVIKDVDKKDLLAIATEIERLSTDAKAGKSKLEDLKGGTFTVTSIGNIGGLISTPIINFPEVGIMGLGKVVKRPLYDANGELKPHDIVYLSFSFDHRIVDGAVGVAFGNAVVRYLQAPALLLLPER